MKTGSSVITVHPKRKIKCGDYKIVSTGNWEATGNCGSAAKNPNEVLGFSVLSKLSLLLP